MPDTRAAGKTISRAIIAGGGTGGHIYPGIAIAQEFRRRNPDCEVVFVGTARGLETRIVPREGFRLELIEVAALKGVSLLKRLRSLALLPAGGLTARRLLRKYKPQVVIGVGGYASGPMVLAAAFSGIPTMIAEQNALPGFTNRRLARFVRAAAVSFTEARAFFGDKAVITGNPVRAEFFDIADKNAAPGDLPHILLTGGSQGARAINEAMMDALPLLEQNGARCTITHQTGEKDFERVRAAYQQHQQHGINAEVKPFIEKIVDEFARADLVICRAGATTVAELAAAGRPALLIPFPFAADDHQRKNAEAVARAGAGRMILQQDISGARLAHELGELLRDPAQLRTMATHSRKLARRDAAASVADLATGIAF
ncbi:MAG: undecaprenyldiphospho-muramoylpentapeptide beta-N-acetylglucosaminyltransferase [Blastocatellia bacterium]